MRVVVFSDTHGNYPLAIRALEKIGVFAQIVHLGDEIEDARIIEELTGQPLLKVPGNCDMGCKDPSELLMEIAGRKIFMTHGDGYQVKSGLSTLWKKAAIEGAEVALYGHTHVAAVTMIEGILFINPGTLSTRSVGASCALLIFSPTEITAEIVPINSW